MHGSELLRARRDLPCSRHSLAGAARTASGTVKFTPPATATTRIERSPSTLGSPRREHFTYLQTGGLPPTKVLRPLQTRRGSQRVRKTVKRRRGPEDDSDIHKSHAGPVRAPHHLLR